MTAEPTTERGRALAAAVRVALTACADYEASDDVDKSAELYDLAASTEARALRLVAEQEQEIARVTAERDAAIASRDEWRAVALEGARLVQASYFAESHLDMVSTGRSLVAWSTRVLPFEEAPSVYRGRGLSGVDEG